MEYVHCGQHNDDDLVRTSRKRVPLAVLTDSRTNAEKESVAK